VNEQNNIAMEYYSWFLFVCVPSLVINTDWRNIIVNQTEIIPESPLRLLEGNNATIHCGSLSPLTWTYSSDDLPFPGQYIVERNSILLINLTDFHSGFYYCYGTHQMETSEIKMFKNYIWIRVEKVPYYGEVLPNRLDVSEGSNVTLECGSMKPVLWFTMNVPNEHKVEEDNKLILTKLRKEHSGPCVCRGVNHNDRVFHSISVILVDPNTQYVS